MASQRFDGVAEVRMILWLLSSNKETLLYFLGTSCSSNSYTQSYTLHQVIIDSKPLTKLLIAAQISDGVAKVGMGLWLCIF